MNETIIITNLAKVEGKYISSIITGAPTEDIEAAINRVSLNFNLRYTGYKSGHHFMITNVAHVNEDNTEVIEELKESDVEYLLWEAGNPECLTLSSDYKTNV